jgi:aspartate kinase
MARQRGVANKMFEALADEGINIQMITTSEIKISVLVARDDAQAALRAVHRAFDLHKEPPALAVAETALPRHTTADAADVARNLQGVELEELFLDSIDLDENQARVTIVGVPDTPGVAAKVFRQVADAGILVDMIVQSFDGIDGRASLSFTVPRAGLAKSETVARELARQFDCQGVTSSPSVAKLSVSGVGLRSHTGVAIRMFKSLADANINLEMINTSEVRVNVIVDGDRGPMALDRLKDAFADVLR